MFIKNSNFDVFFYLSGAVKMEQNKNLKMVLMETYLLNNWKKNWSNSINISSRSHTTKFKKGNFWEIAFKHKWRNITWLKKLTIQSARVYFIKSFIWRIPDKVTYLTIPNQRPKSQQFPIFIVFFITFRTHLWTLLKLITIPEYLIFLLFKSRYDLFVSWKDINDNTR